MKNRFGVISILTASLVGSSVIASDDDKKADLHQIFLAEKLMHAHFPFLRKKTSMHRAILVSPQYSILIEKSLQPMVDETRLECDKCVYLEYLRRSGTNSRVELSTKNDNKKLADEYYTNNCSSDLYQNLSDQDISKLIKNN